MLKHVLPRWFLLAGMSLSLPMAGCAGAVIDEAEGVEDVSDEITDVPQSVVKRQSIGNCWLYATASWVESMELAANDTELNASESYWTYWHWFEQLVNGEVSTEIDTGGSWDSATYLIKRYGVVPEGKFISDEAEAEMSTQQADALAAMNEELKEGSLSTPEARRNRKKVRAALDRAWGLSSSMKGQMTRVFGVGYTRNLTTRSSSGGSETASTTGTSIKRARSIAARYSTGPGKPVVTKTLEQAIASWQEVYYPGGVSSRRDFQKRFQRALHDRQPVIVSWFVDFNALDSQGRFFKPPTRPGHQGGHMTVMEDYQIKNVPGFGTLEAGTVEERPDALEAALSNSAEIEFVRVKNSWGSFREDRQFSTPGYHDLYLAYLNGPVQSCDEKDDGSPDTSSCWDETPLGDVVLPPGY